MIFAVPPLPPSVTVWVVRSRTWWDERQARERVLIAGLAAVLTVFVILNVFWRPVHQARQNAITEIRLYDALAVRLKAAGPTLRAPIGTGPVGPPQAIVTSTAGEAALAIRQIEQQGTQTRVVLDGADFVKLVQWLERLEREAGLSVADAELERQAAPGVVNARLALVKR